MRVRDGGGDIVLRLVVPGFLRFACGDIGLIEREGVAAFEGGAHQTGRIVYAAGCS